MADKYDNFKNLQENEAGNFEIECIDRGNQITVIAPHGGCIESGTNNISKSLADDIFNYYSFVGKKRHDCYKDLHLTSHNYDESKALELVGKSKIVIAIHGCGDSNSKREDKKEIFIGGLNEGLIAEFLDILKEASLSVSFLNKFLGRDSNNICNRGITKKGIQFELTKSFRDDDVICGRFISVVCDCLKTL